MTSYGILGFFIELKYRENTGCGFDLNWGTLFLSSLNFITRQKDNCSGCSCLLLFNEPLLYP